MGEINKDIELITSKLDKINKLLTYLVILQGANAGLNKDMVRKIAGVGNLQVSEIWKSIKKVE